MPQFIDRRLNPRDKSLGNRQRFLRRTREQIKQAVDKAVRERAIGEAAKGGSVSIPSDGIGEPQFHLSDSGGDRERVFPGNKEFVAGDQLDKPPGGRGGSPRDGSDSGGGEDAFSFALSEDEFLDIFFDDLELPDLVKASLKDATVCEYRRAGYSNDGTPPNLNVLRTMRTSLSRRLALRRPERRRHSRPRRGTGRAAGEKFARRRRTAAQRRTLRRDRAAASACGGRFPSSTRSTFATTASTPRPCRAPRR